VKRQITIRRLLAISVIAGLVLAPLSRPVMAGMAADASMPAMAEDMSMAASADAMGSDMMAQDLMAQDLMAQDSMAQDSMASDMPCCPSKAPAPLDCDKCIFMAACATKCFSGISPAVFHPLLAISARILPLRNDSWPDSPGYPPPDHPPRTLI
jgi:pentapeptide MXKDX repeat protein